MFNRLQLMKVHALLAAFILPVAIMYMLTGALYTWGIKGNYDTEIVQVQLTEPLPSTLAPLITIAQQELEALALAMPEGKPRLKTYGQHYVLEWTGSSKDVTLEPSEQPLVATLSIKHTSWYRNLVQLHKAKGGTAFKVYAAMFATAILLLLISGFMMAWQTPKLKNLALSTAALGTLVFLLMVWLS